MPLFLTTDSNPGDASWGDQSFSDAIAASGTLTIPAGGTSGSVDLSGTGLGGNLVLLTLNGATQGASDSAYAFWEGETLNIELDADPGEGDSATVAYAVLAPLVSP